MTVKKKDLREVLRLKNVDFSKLFQENMNFGQMATQGKKADFSIMDQMQNSFI